MAIDLCERTFAFATRIVCPSRELDKSPGVSRKNAVPTTAALRYLDWRERRGRAMRPEPGGLRLEDANRLQRGARDTLLASAHCGHGHRPGGETIPAGPGKQRTCRHSYDHHQEHKGEHPLMEN